jgi:uncharacterized membrane protein
VVSTEYCLIQLQVPNCPVPSTEMSRSVPKYPVPSTEMSKSVLKCPGTEMSRIHAIVVLACKQFVWLCFVYLVLYSFNITLSWSAIMLLDSVLINFICNCIYVWMSLLLCMSMYTWAYAFMLLESVLINFICNCVLCMHEFAFMYDYVYMSLCFILMSMHACFFILSPTKLRRDIVTLPSVRPSHI